MCLHPQGIYLIPEQTAQVARAILPDGNLCLRLYDELGTIYSDSLFADLFPRREPPPPQPPQRPVVVTPAAPHQPIRVSAGVQAAKRTVFVVPVFA